MTLRNVSPFIKQFLAFLILFQALHWIGNNLYLQRLINISNLEVQKRIALDAEQLRLYPEWMSTRGDNPYLRDYLLQINHQLAEAELPIRVNAIQSQVAVLDTPWMAEKESILLDASYQSLTVELLYKKSQWYEGLHWYPGIAALLLSSLMVFASKSTDPKLEEAEESSQDIVLHLDLHQRLLGLNVSEQKVQLSNKPFCFYMAILNYCIEHDQPILNQNAELPQGLLELANKYFHRLTELGHTIRKKPDFSSNLDKTLSEIRAALDEVFSHHPDEKLRFYPPKAQGEGSRSKRHNYALLNIREQHFEIVGK